MNIKEAYEAYPELSHITIDEDRDGTGMVFAHAYGKQCAFSLYGPEYFGAKTVEGAIDDACNELMKKLAKQEAAA